MPHLKELYAAKKDEGLVLLGIHSTNGGEKMKEFVEKKKITYPVAVDKAGATVKAFGGNSYPDYFLIDRAGNLRFADLANGELDRAVDFLLAEKAPEPKADAPGDAPAEEPTEPATEPATDAPAASSPPAAE